GRHTRCHTSSGNTRWSSLAWLLDRTRMPLLISSRAESMANQCGKTPRGSQCVAFWPSIAEKQWLPLPGRLPDWRDLTAPAPRPRGRPGAGVSGSADLLDFDPARMICDMDQRALIFLHIPKTAGTTLNRIIEWQYDPFSIFTMDPHGDGKS